MCGNALVTECGDRNVEGFREGLTETTNSGGIAFGSGAVRWITILTVALSFWTDVRGMRSWLREDEAEDLLLECQAFGIYILYATH